MKLNKNSLIKYWLSILTITTIFYFLYHSHINQKQQTDFYKSISTNHYTINNQTILTNNVIGDIGINLKNNHLISVFVGTTCTMQIKADNFSIKDGILTCQSANRNFYIMGSMHSIVIEEMKSGQSTITAIPNNKLTEDRK